MKGVIDRIEDGKSAVVIWAGGRQMIVPVEEFGFDVHEGMHLTIEFKPDPEMEEKLRREIKDLQSELLKRTEEADKKEKE
ncbi:MAG: hypothetical protein DDT32_01667 [Syntrophomonadaceae bacterium]|nr:hypothetical protein [Bacillota bacterium]